MAKERLVGMDEIERRLFGANIRDEIVDRNIDFEDK